MGTGLMQLCDRGTFPEQYYLGSFLYRVYHPDKTNGLLRSVLLNSSDLSG